MIARGEWKAEAAFNGIAGFHISELYSPWVKWSDTVENFLKAKRLPETLKVWVNTSLGETWKEATEGIDPSGLLKRKENWGRIANRSLTKPGSHANSSLTKPGSLANSSHTKPGSLMPPSHLHD